MITLNPAVTPVRAFGAFVALSLDIVAALFRRPFAWREVVLQVGFVVKVSLLPSILLTIPYSVFAVFLLNILLIEMGAGDLSGAGAAFLLITQLSPIALAIVVSGAGASAMCADLGARTIREEIDAMRVIGIDPVQALALPRVIAATIAALLLFAVVSTVGLVFCFVFVVYVQHVTPGAFVGGLPLLTGLPEVTISLIKAALFGMSAGLIACYKGFSVGGGATGVGNAVNETVVFSFMSLFVINLVVTALGVEVTR